MGIAARLPARVGAGVVRRISPLGGSGLAVLCSVVLLVGATILGLRSGMHHELYRALLYPTVARRVTAGAATPQEAADRLAAFVYLNVRTPVGAPVIDDSAADVLIRGFGYCDQAVFAFVRLLEEVGIRGRVTELRTPDGASPHTVAEVLLGGDWRVYDVFYGFTPRAPDGQVATRQQIVADPALLGPSRAQPSWYADATVFSEPIPPSSQPGVRGRLAGAASAVASAAPGWLMDRLQDLYLLLPPPRYTGYVDGPDGAHTKPFEDYTAADARRFFRARNLQLFQRPADAADAYRALIRHGPSGEYADDARYELGLLELTLQNRPDAAVRTLDRLLTVTPGTPWAGEATHLEARAFIDLGQCPRATPLLEGLAGTIAAAAEDARQQLAGGPCRVA